MNPKYSFIIPAYNEEALIGGTLAALLESVKVLKGAHEIIVVNDASTDRTAEIAREKGARVIDVKKRQIGAVRNAGAAIASGEIFIFVDADTQVTPETFRELEALLEDRRIVAAGARMVFDQPPPLWGRIAAGFFLRMYFAARLAAGGFLVARSEAFRKVGGFDERYFCGEEVHLSKALKRVGRLRIVKAPVITSARKFRMKPFREHFALFRSLARKGPKGWEDKEGLDMWYDGQREK